MLKVYAVRRSKGDPLLGSEGYEAGLGGEIRYHRIFITADDGGGFRLFQHSSQGGEYVIWWGIYGEYVFDMNHSPPNS